MVRTIALCCDENRIQTTVTLLKYGNIRVFSDGVQLASYLQEGGECSLVVVIVGGPKGMNYCTFVRGQNKEVPILWVSDDEKYESIAKKISVNDFWVGPLPDMLLEKVAGELLCGTADGKQ